MVVIVVVNNSIIVVILITMLLYNSYSVANIQGAMATSYYYFSTLLLPRRALSQLPPMRSAEAEYIAPDPTAGCMFVATVVVPRCGFADVVAVNGQ